MRNFYEMERKFGPGAAYYCLLEIEKAARIPWMETYGIDPETRFQNACRKQDAMAVQDILRVAANRVA